MRLTTVSSWALVTFLLGGGFTTARAATPLLDCQGLPCVDVAVGQGPNARHLKLGVDTGDQESILTLAAAQALGLVPNPLPDAGPNAKTPSVQLAGAKVGDFALDGATFYVADLSAYQARGTFPKIDGTLALSALKDRRLDLDFAGHTVAICEAAGAAVAAPGKIALITFGKRGPPILVATSGFAVNGKPISTQVDSMFAGTLLVYDSALTRLSLIDARQRTAQKTYFPFTDDGVDTLTTVAADESFAGSSLLKNAPLYFALPKVHQPDALFDATVGVGLLRSHALHVDFHAKTLWLDGPAGCAK